MSTLTKQCAKCGITKECLSSFYKSHTMINYYKECKKCMNAKPNTHMGFSKQPLDVKLRTIELLKEWRDGNMKLTTIVKDLLKEFPDSKLNYAKVYNWNRNGWIAEETEVLFPI
jgi:hypothetical protein